MLPDTGNTREQVERNKEGVEDLKNLDNPVFRRVSETALIASSDLGITRRAKVTENAPAGFTITANLYNFFTGVEETETGIIVFCNISNGIDLNEAGPLLISGNDISVYQSVWTDGNTTETRWYCATNFDTDEDCACG